MRKINFENYFLGTVANFTKCRVNKLPKRKPDYISGSGSSYWYEGDLVFRQSGHFFRSVASCKWFLDGLGKKNLAGQGFCKINEFIERMAYSALKPSLIYKIYYAAKDRQGYEHLEVFTDKFIKATTEFLIFEKKKISKYTFCTAVNILTFIK